MNDNTYKLQPKVMSKRVIDALINKVVLHCERHNIQEFLFAFHGGEPLLCGQNIIEYFVRRAHDQIDNIGTKLFFTIQTNGTLLSKEWCDLLKEMNIHVGISLDGNKKENDINRVDHRGRGSYDKVINGINTFLQYGPSSKRLELLSVIDINSDPISRYQHLKGLGAKKIDFLLPYYTFDALRVDPNEIENKNYPTPYADWLIQIFNLWIRDNPEERVSIRLFNGIIDSILGKEFPADLLGSYFNQLLVVETNGEIEAVDALKVCGEGFTKSGINILNSTLDQAMENDLINLYYTSHQKLCKRCLCCPVKEICGGGYLPHRYSKKNGFNNPSVFCHDLLKLIVYIQNFIIDKFPPELREKLNVGIISHEEALAMLQTQECIGLDYSSELENF